VKPNCYDCIHRGEVPGDCHSCCNHPRIAGGEGLLALIGLKNPLGVTGNAHGVKKGWFCWPLNFDQVWLENCNGFEPRKEVNETHESTENK